MEGEQINPVELIVGNKNLMNPSDNIIDDGFIDRVARQVELRSKLLKTALKALRTHDVIDFGGKPYIEGEGAARIMAAIGGFVVGKAEFTEEIIPPHYFLTCELPIEFKYSKGSTIAIGESSTADIFFTGKDGVSGNYGKHLDRTGSEVTAARLLRGDAMKKARENAMSRGVTELLGLKGLSWEDLAELGFSRSKAGSNINFKSGSAGGELKTLTVKDALALPKGSKFNLRGFLSDTETKEVKKRDGSKGAITKYKITDNVYTIIVGKFGDHVSGVTVGEGIYCENVSVSEYQGSLQYLADDVSPMIGEETHVVE